MPRSVLRSTLEDLEAALGAALENEEVAEAFMQHASAVLDAEEQPLRVHVGRDELSTAVALLTALIDGPLFQRVLTDTDAEHSADPAWRLGVLCAALQLAADALALAGGKDRELAALGTIISARLEQGDLS
jgi:hypothetical protein